MKRLRSLASYAIAIGGWATSSCAPSGFQDVALVNGVRILASSADHPYAKPGSTVRVQVLASDGRPTKTGLDAGSNDAGPPIHWLPLVCENPVNDAYYGCFRQFGGRGAANAGAGSAATLVTSCGGASSAPIGPGGLQPGIDLTPFLPAGDCVEFTMPVDAVAAHSKSPPAPVPFGLAILFNIACTGHLELVALDPANIQAPPIGCFDAQHNRLGASDYVFGFTRVYAYDALENANPLIDHIDVDGQALDPTDPKAVIVAQHCSTGSNCARIHVGPVVPPSSQEPNPEEHDAKGNPVREEIWAEYFCTFGSFNNDARLLYDATTGSVGGPSETDNQFLPPDHPGDGTIWIIVHDNRGGATWAAVPVHVL